MSLLPTEGICERCGQYVKYYSMGVRLCHLCREKVVEEMFEGITGTLPAKSAQEEPEFELKHEVAQIKEVDPTTYNRIADSNENELYEFSGACAIKIPKAYHIDLDKVTPEDMELILRAFFSDVVFLETHPMFDEIKHLLKEIGD